MEQGIVFIETLSLDVIRQHTTAVLHLMCRHGSIRIRVQNRDVIITAGDYAIFPNISMIREIEERTKGGEEKTKGESTSEETRDEPFVGDVFVLNSEMAHRLRSQNNYGMFGHLSLLSEPVMHLSPAEYTVCAQDIRLLRERLQLTEHTYYHEMIETLTMVHVLNLYDIHARRSQPTDIPKRAAELMQRFVEQLETGVYRTERELGYYASELCITPHYLSEISRLCTHQPASYWIELYTVNEIVRQLTETSRSLSEIAFDLHFSSEAYFTRYVRKFLGTTPSQFRKRRQE